MFPHLPARHGGCTCRVRNIPLTRGSARMNCGRGPRRNMKKLWLLLGGVMVLSFVVLGWIGAEIYHQAPPFPEKVITKAGTAFLSKEDIQSGQNVWQALGGM